MVSPLVVRLFFGCRPAAVAWLIVSVRVDTIDAVLLRRCTTHVFDEVLPTIRIGFIPFSTHLDSATSVILIGHVSLVFSPLVHHRPDTLFTWEWIRIHMHVTTAADLGIWLAREILRLGVELLPTSFVSALHPPTHAFL
ncbi:hypothetical protein MAINES_00120 [Brevundimonas phage vB_BpoS-MaInes]|nr:hypothetical protein MAINES_00120 [Brevundimonas phage vB_BpoS-MaInes]